MAMDTDVVIIGAGPYGLSIATHLQAAGVGFRIFGEPMKNWITRMPKGMHLKSDGFASSLFDPERRFTLSRYCNEQGIPYADLGSPVPVEVFSNYGVAFQKQCVPTLDRRWVDKLRHESSGFTLTVSDGSVVRARRVVVATGISHFEYMPPELAHLPASACSHSGDNCELSQHRNRDVLLLGSGASSTDIAALLVNQCKSVQIVSHRPVVFHLPPSAKPPSIWRRMRNPNFGLGPSLRSAAYTLFPRLFHRLPERLRLRIVRRHLGPAAVWFIRDQLQGRVPMHSGYDLLSADMQGDRVNVCFANRDGGRLEVQVDHIIAGTGYRVDLRRLPFLDADLRVQLRLAGGSPVLSRNFESSVPGLYFVGLASAASFGPLTRFAHGAGFTARNISAHLCRHRSKESTRALRGVTS